MPFDHILATSSSSSSNTGHPVTGVTIAETKRVGRGGEILSIPHIGNGARVVYFIQNNIQILYVGRVFVCVPFIVYTLVVNGCMKVNAVLFFKKRTK